MSKKIVYIFRLASGDAHRFDVDLDRPRASGNLPEWTQLEVEKCPHCPLPPTAGARCPAAADLVPMVEKFSKVSSTGRIEVHVLTSQYEATKRTDAQTALSALMGLILATSHCPILSRMRPMAQTHTPFATPTEVVYRFVSMHLVGCFLRGEPSTLRGLKDFFADIDRLNYAFAGRLQRAATLDAGINALLLLHARGNVASWSFNEEIENIRKWFAQTRPDSSLTAES